MDIVLIGSGSGVGFSLYALVIEGSCQVLKFIENSDQRNQNQIVSLFNLITKTGPPHNKEKYRNLGNGIYELKTRGGLRVLSFTGGANLRKSLILTHAIKKPHDRVVIREKEKALRWRGQFFNQQITFVDLKQLGQSS